MRLLLLLLAQLEFYINVLLAVITGRQDRWVKLPMASWAYQEWADAEDRASDRPASREVRPG